MSPFFKNFPARAGEAGRIEGARAGAGLTDGGEGAEAGVGLVAGVGAKLSFLGGGRPQPPVAAWAARARAEQSGSLAWHKSHWKPYWAWWGRQPWRWVANISSDGKWAELHRSQRCSLTRPSRWHRLHLGLVAWEQVWALAPRSSGEGPGLLASPNRTPPHAKVVIRREQRGLL